ncbi:MAG: hypothetical protein M5U07_22110 [Xanthobacteraceae bacterium]|nr:hypothetical protein [Xanthobacteraceae bacterium]
MIGQVLSQAEAARMLRVSGRLRVAVDDVPTGLEPATCQSACKFDPASAFNFAPLERRALAVALAPSELVGVAETARARVV